MNVYDFFLFGRKNTGLDCAGVGSSDKGVSTAAHLLIIRTKPPLVNQASWKKGTTNGILAASRRSHQQELNKRWRRPPGRGEGVQVPETTLLRDTSARNPAL